MGIIEYCSLPLTPTMQLLVPICVVQEIAASGEVVCCMLIQFLTQKPYFGRLRGLSSLRLDARLCTLKIGRDICMPNEKYPSPANTQIVGP